MSRLRDIPNLDKPLPLPAFGGLRESVHLFDPDSILAIDAALACGRPLLIRGEPGVGKSQLARAAAQALGRVFVSRFVDARTEAHDLLWFYDAVTRLAEAQVQRQAGQVGDALARINFVQPGPLWWALNWDDATQQAIVTKTPKPAIAKDCAAEKGVVLLIDEIDKAESSVPNGLLEALGHGTFTVPGREQPVSAEGPTPLVILTSNEDRSLPDAFVRRCVVLPLRLPGPRQELLDWLVQRGQAHRPDLDAKTVLIPAAEQVADDRKKAEDDDVCAPGLAEYVDLLQALTEGGSEGAKDRIAKLAPFFLRKHADPKRS